MADALGGAQAVEQIELRRAGQQFGEVGEALPDGSQRGDAVVVAAQMRGCSTSASPARVAPAAPAPG